MRLGLCLSLLEIGSLGGFKHDVDLAGTLAPVTLVSAGTAPISGALGKTLSSLAVSSGGTVEDVAFAPSDVSGLHAWWRADANTLNSTTISQLTDLSGNGRHMVQATGANQPLYVATSAAFNNQDVARFDGTLSYLSCTTVLTGTGCSIYIVGRRIGAAGVSDGILALGNAGNDYDSVGTLFVGDASGSGNIFTQRNSAPVTSVTTPGINVLYGFEQIIDAAQYDLRVNSDTATSASGPNGSLATGLSIMGARVVAGAAYLVDACPNMEIAEVIIYDNAISAGDQTSVRAYLTSRYALSGF